MIPMHSAQVTPAIIAVAHAHNWSQGVSLVQTEVPRIVVMPKLVANIRGQWLPISVPGLRLPKIITLNFGVAQNINISARNVATPPFMPLRIEWVPEHKKSTATTVVALPALALDWGHSAPIKTQISASAPWILWGGVGRINVSLKNLGTTWAPAAATVQVGNNITQLDTGVPIQVGGVAKVGSAMLGPLAPGFHTIVVSAPGAKPVPRQVVDIPPLPIIMAALGFSMAEVWNLIARKRKGR